MQFVCIMMRAAIAAICIAVSTGSSVDGRGTVKDDHPIAKVITMLQGLSAKAKAEGAAEEISYTKFEYWCRTSKTMLTADIDKRAANIDMLKNSIDAKDGEIKTLGDEIDKLQDEITAHEKSISSATTARSDANGLWDSADRDYTDTITAIKSCITSLESAQTKTESLVSVQRAQNQVEAVLGFLEMKATAAEMHTIHNFLGLTADPIKALGDYGKHVDKYKFKSLSVIELLKELQTKFEDEQRAALKAETDAANAHELSMMDLNEAKRVAKDSKSTKEGIKADTEISRNADKAEKEAEESAKEGSEATLKATESSCALKASEWKERSDIRANEIASLEAAVKILSKVTGVRTEPPTNPALAAGSFVQRVIKPRDAEAKAVKLLLAAAKSTRSHTLERLAMAISAKSDGIHYNKPGAFDEIINMIQKMIYKLQADQTDEDNHKLWCDQELEKTATSIADKDMKVKELGAKITDLKASEAELTMQIEKDAQLMEELTAKMKEMTEIREAGKKENALAIKDAEDALEALAQATAVLEDFYKSSGAVPKQPWESLLQGDPAVELPANPATWDSSYTSVADPLGGSGPTTQPTGIITLLKTVAKSFSEMVADTKAQDATDQDTYNEFKKSNSIEMARVTKESEMLSQQRTRANANILSETEAKKNTQKQLDSWNQYNEDLKPACVESDSTYEDRKSARTTEIGALEQAETILKTAFDEEKDTSFISSPGKFLQIKQHRP
mmetsp:Transcript_119364/g.207213  ORF Transcript_119364/g.207213 Transcript_119364/m.207213 type:complete len:735 (+) Transcript_119364:22-2226(+)